MSSPLRITSAENPRIKAVIRLREHRQRRRSGLFVAEGRREVERAAAAGLAAQELFFCPAMLGGAALPELPAGVPRIEVPPGLLGAMAYNENPEGLLAVFQQRAWTVEDLSRRWAGGDQSPLVLVAVGTAKPGNLGAMVRTAAAAGAAGVVAADTPVDIYNPNAIRASTGAVFSLPVVALDRAELLALARQWGLRLLAASPAAPMSYLQADLRGPTGLLIGPEDTGLDGEWMEAASLSGGGPIRIPMDAGAVDSLNASAAAAVLLFEAARQRAAGAGNSRE